MDCLIPTNGSMAADWGHPALRRIDLDLRIDSFLRSEPLLRLGLLKLPVWSPPMFNRLPCPIKALTFVVLAISGLVSPCVAQVVPVVGRQAASGDFRVVTTVHTASQEKPIAKHLIVLRGGVVYDLGLTAERYVTVYDEAKSRVVMLDRETNVRTEYSTNELLERAARARTTEQDPAKKLKLGLGAEVKRTNGGDYAISFGNVTYSTTSQRPASPLTALRFARFADWAMRLNIACGSPIPPWARMSLNAALGKDGVLPDELQITAEAKVYRISHELTEALSADDTQRVDEVDSMLALYRKVPPNQFPAE